MMEYKVMNLMGDHILRVYPENSSLVELMDLIGFSLKILKKTTLSHRLS